MPVHPYPRWPLFNRSVVAAFQRSLTGMENLCLAGGVALYASRN